MRRRLIVGNADNVFGNCVRNAINVCLHLCSINVLAHIPFLDKNIRLLVTYLRKKLLCFRKQTIQERLLRKNTEQFAGYSFGYRSGYRLLKILLKKESFSFIVQKEL